MKLSTVIFELSVFGSTVTFKTAIRDFFLVNAPPIQKRKFLVRTIRTRTHCTNRCDVFIAIQAPNTIY